MKHRWLAVTLVLMTLGACDDIRWIDLRPQADHQIAGWTQADLGGGVWSDVSVDWKITNTGDVWCYASMGVAARVADGTEYGAPGVGLKIDEGKTATGTITIPTSGNQVITVFIKARKPGPSD